MDKYLVREVVVYKCGQSAQGPECENQKHKLWTVPKIQGRNVAGLDCVLQVQIRGVSKNSVIGLFESPRPSLVYDERFILDCCIVGVPLKEVERIDSTSSLTSFEDDSCLYHAAKHVNVNGKAPSSIEISQPCQRCWGGERGR